MICPGILHRLREIFTGGVGEAASLGICEAYILYKYAFTSSGKKNKNFYIQTEIILKSEISPPSIL